MIIYYKNANNTKKCRQIPVLMLPPLIPFSWLVTRSAQHFYSKKRPNQQSKPFAKLVIICLYLLCEGIRVQAFKFFQWLFCFLFLIILNSINQHQIKGRSSVCRLLRLKPYQMSHSQAPSPLFSQIKYLPFLLGKFCLFLSSSPDKSFLLRFSYTTATIASLTTYHPSKIKGINTCNITLAWPIFWAKLQMKVNIRGLEGTGESNSQCPLMSFGPTIKNACQNSIFSDYNLNMISKSKEIQENLLYYNSKQALQFSTAQEKDSHSNARPFQQTFPQIVEENCEEEPLTPQNSFWDFLEESDSESNTSFEKMLTFEHLACLQVNIQEITKHVLKVPKSLDLTQLCVYEFQDNQQTFGTFIQGSRSPIPPSQRPQFLTLLRQNSCLRKVITWIYGHVQSQLSDELILTAHRIALAYHPIKAFVAGAAELQKLADLEFNIWNAYNDPALKMLQYSQMLQLRQEGLYFDGRLHRFFRFYLVTILLVLQEYFENPDYGNTLGLKLCPNRKNDPVKHKKTSKSKAIRKREKSNH